MWYLLDLPPGASRGVVIRLTDPGRHQLGIARMGRTVERKLRRLRELWARKTDPWSGDHPAGETPPPQDQERARRVDEACDRFAAAWVAGGRPRLEEVLASMPEPGRPELLRELLKCELTYRRMGGERPAASEYLARFPGHEPLIGEVFGEGGPAPPAADRPPGASPDHDADRTRR
jgi:hypothetical protein